MHPRLSKRARIACALSLLALAAASAEAVTQPFTKGSTLDATSPRTVGNLKFVLNPYHGLIVQDATGGVLWRSGLSSPCGTSPCWATYQGDGNFLIRRQDSPTSSSVPWVAYTAGTVPLTLSSEAPYITIEQPPKAPWTTGVAPVSVAYLPGGLTLAAGSRITVADTSLELTTGGDVQARRVSTNALLWRSGTAAACTQPTSCTLAFDANGALKLTGPAGAGNVIWTAGVATTGAGTLVLSKYAPYLSIQDAGPNNTSPVKWASGSNASSVTFASNAFVLSPGEQRSIGDTVLALTAGGNIEVTKAGAPAWSSGTSCVVASGCYLKFGADGHLVLYRGGGQTTSLSLVNINNGGYLQFSATAPHLSVENTKFERIWASGPFTPPPQRTVALPVRGNDYRAQTVQSFLETLGINVHANQIGTSAQLKARLDAVGLSTIRIDVPADAAQLQTYQELAANGVRFNLGGYNTNAAFVAQQVRALVAATPGSVESVEGLNEINNFGSGFNGFTCRAGSPNNCGGAVVDAQASLFNTITQDPLLSAVTVYSLSGGLSSLQAPQYGLLALSGRAHYATVHPYTIPADEQPQATFSRIMDAEYTNLTPWQGVVTEAGYSTGDVSQESQAILNINAWLDGYRLGYRRTFLYELLDSGTQGYGFFTQQGSPKRVVQVAKNLTNLLKDTGAPLQQTGVLAWDNSLFSGNWILLQKSDRRFYLILWNEPDVADGKTDRTITPTPVLISVPNSQSIKVYDPYRADPLIPTPVQTLGLWASGVWVDIGSHAVVVEVTPY
ncbi:MAG: hypothetical protein EPO12_14985 [Aquabacterium sp.]|nr:MAG: hypothetical protein EPO12_14985 [Aquabacterium sp.]